jgi:dCTP deaminase
VIFSNEDIQQAIGDGRITIDPRPAEDQYTTSAVDLFLGSRLQTWDSKRLTVPGVKVVLNLAEQKFLHTADAYLTAAPLDTDGTFTLPPQGFVLGVTRERIDLKHASRLAARVEGRSSLARLGLAIHLTAPTIHAGFNGNIALEIYNAGPFHLKLVPNTTRICQLIFEELKTVPMGSIKTGFQGQSDASGTK